MKHPTLWASVLIAAIISTAAGVAYQMLILLFQPVFTLKLIISMIIFSYGAILCVFARNRAGRGLVLLMLLFGQFGLLALSTPALLSALVGALQIWVARSLLFSKNLLEWLVDGAVISAGVISAIYLASRGFGIAGIVWGFLLSQSLFVLVPDVRTRICRLTRVGDRDPTWGSQTDLRFLRAVKSAEAAISRLATD